MHRLIASLITLSVALAATAAHADIFQWEYSADPYVGKQQSTTLAPDGAGVDAVPGAELGGRDLTMAYLFDADLTDANLSSSRLNDAYLPRATLVGTDFTGAQVRGADFTGSDINLAQLYSTASYQAHDLSGISLQWNNLAGANVAGQNLAGASFAESNLAGADLSRANLSSAYFGAVGFPSEGANLLGADLSEANLTNAIFWEANLGGADLSLANLTNAQFDNGSYGTFAGADFTGADLRGAIFEFVTPTPTSDNLIDPEGHISGLELDPGELLFIRDYDGAPPYNPALPTIPITVDLHMAMAPGGTLRMVFEADAWDSTISFAPGIPVTLGGTLELTFAADVNPATQLGRTFELFNWTGATPVSAFAVSSPYAWDLSNLYTTGQVTLTAIPEPTTLVLLLIVAIALFVARRTPLCVGRRLCAGISTSRRLSTAGLLVSLSPLLLVSPSPARADIFQWEYINPANPALGKQQSTTLCLDGAGVDAVSGASLAGRNLTMAYLIGAHLRYDVEWDDVFTNLTATKLNQADLSDANFDGAYLTNADLTGAEIRGASFNVFYYESRNVRYGGLTLAQLYSTASYQAHDLSGISLQLNNLAGANFTGQNLTDAVLDVADLTGADFTNAEVRGARFTRGIIGPSHSSRLQGGISLAQLYSTASYAAHDLSGIYLGGNDLSGANLSGQNLTGATLGGYLSFDLPDLTGADFTNAEVRGASLAGITFTQLYSTATYATHDLSGIGLAYSDLSSANFAGFNLTGANFNFAMLTDANLSEADFTGASVSGANFNNADLTLAQLYSTSSFQYGDLGGIGLANTDLSGANFSNKNFSSANFSGADIRQANLTNANLGGTTLAGADLAGAEVRGANFGNYHQSGIALAQLYSTASYKANDLSGISLGGNHLAGANFAGQNLTNADFASATLTDANFTAADVQGANFFLATLTGANFADAEVRGAHFDRDFYSTTGTGISLAQLYSTASYQAHDLSGISLLANNLAGANFAGQNLTNANFLNARLTGADFSGAEIRGANFDRYNPGTGITLAQLYSTASYQAHDLSGISLEVANLAGANFAGQNLTNAIFSYATLTGADFTAADARGAFLPSFPANAITNNFIRPDGHINGLVLDGGGLLVVRDYDGNPNNTLYPYNAIPPIPITIDQHQSMAPGGTLRMVFEADAWDSTISFAPGIPVTLGGTLELTFAADVNPATQLGRTFELFNWTGATPVSAFAVSSPYVWDLSRLYTTGEITLAAIPEPTTVVLLIMAAGICVNRRRIMAVS